MILLTETSELGMYGKYNLLGANCSDTIYVSHFPYLLMGQLFIAVKCSPGQKAHVYLNDSTVGEKQALAKVLNDENHDHSIFRIPIKFKIVNCCSIDFICETNFENETKRYKITEGKAPKKSRDKFVQESGIVQRTMRDFLSDLISSATSEILINDTYFDIANLINLFSNQSAGVSAKIITGPNYLSRSNQNNCNLERVSFKSSLKIHDRFVCLDRDEVWVFGYSFKELVGEPSRISFYTKIYNKHDIEEFRNIFFETWDNPQ